MLKITPFQVEHIEMVGYGYFVRGVQCRINTIQMMLDKLSRLTCQMAKFNKSKKEVIVMAKKGGKKKGGKKGGCK